MNGGGSSRKHLKISQSAIILCAALSMPDRYLVIRNTIFICGANKIPYCLTKSPLHSIAKSERLYAQIKSLTLVLGE